MQLNHIMASFLKTITFVLLLPRFSSFPILTNHRHNLLNQPDDDYGNQIRMLEGSVERRYFMKSINVSSIMGSLLMPKLTRAEMGLSESTNDASDLQKIHYLLHEVPVFTIVDHEAVPYMVVGEDAKISCYFFTTFAEATRLLTLARKSAEPSSSQGKNGSKEQSNDYEPFVNPWDQAVISSVPLDFAVRLARRGKFGGAYFYVAPADEDVNDALALNPEVQELDEGKVPLFYIEDFTIQGERSSSSSSSPSSNKKSPLFFRKKELIKEWRKHHPMEKQEPPIKVTELFAVLRIMLASKDANDDVQSIIFIPPMESARKAKECLHGMGKKDPFQLGKRILVL